MSENYNLIKIKVKEWFNNHINDVIYPDEIADQLNLDFEVVMNVTMELIKENFIEVYEKDKKNYEKSKKLYKNINKRVD